MAATASDPDRKREEEEERPPPPQPDDRRARYISDYMLPLAYPARVVVAAGFGGPDDDDDDDEGKGGRRAPRTSSEFVNARLIEAGLPLGGVVDVGNTSSSSSSSSSSSLASHSASIGRFVRDMEGTGCYDAVRVRLGMPSSATTTTSSSSSSSSSTSSPSSRRYDVTVKLREKRWYRLHVGGGINADDLSSIVGGGVGNGVDVPKLQFEASASLLNLTGYADVSSASYSVDQTGSPSFVLAHDRPLASCRPSRNGRRRGVANVVVKDDDDYGTSSSSSSTTTPITSTTRTSLGLHATFRDDDHERTRSSRERVRAVGARLANHNVGSDGACRPSTSPPEAMAGPYLFAEWNASIRDVLPRRFPAAAAGSSCRLDCSREVALEAGTSIKHSLSAGAYMNGCRVDRRHDPTSGYDAHVVGELAGPPGDVGYWKIRGGLSCHLPVRSLLRSTAPRAKDDDGKDDIANDCAVRCHDGDSSSAPTSVTGAALHSSFNCGVIRPLTFGGSLGDSNGAAAPSSLPLLSDRFYVGGPGQLRGFLPAGIGPRSSGGGSCVPGGDALGGDLFYTSTLAVSAPFPSYLSALRGNGARLFGFANAGTCVSASPLVGTGCSPVWNRILLSSRLAVGGGVSVGSPMGRFEATYAVPLRYGPRDARRSVQFGLGLTF
ncbi:hypothetical protein ACHAW5_009209 [Stephanodiscus triporus]|uniref:Bacterial surface antigen (D15) domain-containing protein n=1 Tax=Stephanodiscus triporus TaxID=2934178 RepID=A0ABD3PM61_9STRA